MAGVAMLLIWQRVRDLITQDVAPDALGALRIGLAATRSQKLGRVVKLEEID
jgi:hypothetical protein